MQPALQVTIAIPWTSCLLAIHKVGKAHALLHSNSHSGLEMLRQTGFVWCRYLSNVRRPWAEAWTGQLGYSLQQSAHQKHLRMRALLRLASVPKSSRSLPCPHRCLPYICSFYMKAPQRPQVCGTTIGPQTKLQATDCLVHAVRACKGCCCESMLLCALQVAMCMCLMPWRTTVMRWTVSWAAALE